MDEGIAIRAITIGVSVLIALATMTGVIAYYNIAKQTVVSIGTGVNISKLYTESIRNSLLKEKPNGADIKNLINYFYEDKLTRINIVSMELYKNTEGSKDLEKISQDNINNPDSELSRNKYKKIMKFLMPNQYFNLRYELNNDGILVVNINKI